MFDQLVESAPVRKKNKRWHYFTATAALWVFALTGMIVVGIFAYDARLDSQYKDIVMVAPALPPAPTPVSVGPQPRAARPQQVEGFIPVKEIPDTITPPSSKPPVMPRDFGPIGDGPGVPGGIGPGGGGTGVSIGPGDGLISDSRQIEPPPPPPPPQPKPETPAKSQIIRSHVLQGSAIKRVEPTYPAIAKAVGVGGAVVVEVTIDERGNVISARALSGHALLRDGCLAAARVWRWQPTLLNGVPVKVVGTITFNFQR